MNARILSILIAVGGFVMALNPEHVKVPWREALLAVYLGWQAGVCCHQVSKKRS